MPLLEWTEDFVTGIDYVDYEHRRLIDLINRTCADLAKARGQTVVGDDLGQIYNAVSAHFALEESVMRERKHDRYDAHKADHEQMLEDMRYMMDAYENGLCETCGQTLDDCLRTWFHRHFRRAEADLESAAGS